MDRLLTGIGDGCDNCVAPPSTWSDVTAIEAGFPKDRSLESIKQKYDDLEKNSRGDIKKVTGDFETRQGICGEPVSLRETFSFTLTHKVKLRVNNCSACYKPRIENRPTHHHYHPLQNTKQCFKV